MARRASSAGSAARSAAARVGQRIVTGSAGLARRAGARARQAVRENWKDVVTHEGLGLGTHALLWYADQKVPNVIAGVKPSWIAVVASALMTFFVPSTRKYARRALNGSLHAVLASGLNEHGQSAVARMKAAASPPSRASGIEQGTVEEALDGDHAYVAAEALDGRVSARDALSGSEYDAVY